MPMPKARDAGLKPAYSTSARAKMRPAEPELSLVLLRPAGLNVRLVSPRLAKGIRRAGLKVSRRPVRMGDVDSADLIFAATSDSSVNAALAKRARAQLKLVSVADAPELGNFALPAVAKAGPLRV